MKTKALLTHTSSILAVVGALASLATLLDFFVKKVGLDKELIVAVVSGIIALLVGLYSKSIANQVRKLSPYSRVFLAYSYRDKDVASKLAERLRNLQFKVWLNDEQLTPGMNWEDRIHEAIENADIFLVLLSPSVTSSPYLDFELNKVQKKEDIKILPVLLESTSIPSEIKNYPIINISEDKDAGIDKVVKKVSLIAKK